MKVKLLSRVWLFATTWAVTDQAPPSVGFSRQEYWSGLPFLSSEDLPNPGIEPRSSAFMADSLLVRDQMAALIPCVCRSHGESTSS